MLQGLFLLNFYLLFQKCFQNLIVNVLNLYLPKVKRSKSKIIEICILFVTLLQFVNFDMAGYLFHARKLTDFNVWYFVCVLTD